MHTDDGGIFPELHHMNRANVLRAEQEGLPEEVKSTANESQAQYHDMLARLAANRERNRLRRYLTPQSSVNKPRSSN